VTGYILSSIAWSVFGFITGYITCKVVTNARLTEVEMEERRDRRRRNRRKDDAPVPVVVESPVAISTTDGRSGRRWLRDKIFEAVFITLAVLAIVQGLFVQKQLSDKTNCQSNYNLQVAQAVTARATIADRESELINEDRSALLQLITTITSPAGSTPQEQRAAVEDALQQYLKTEANIEKEREAANQDRRQHPLPDLSQLSRC
jgi:hypothetical protein